MTDRDRLIELLKASVYGNIDEGFYGPELNFENVADHLLANGVIVQQQGEWKTTQEPLGWKDVECVECSACHESWICDEENDFEFYKEFWKYCPNCGARMECEGK